MTYVSFTRPENPPAGSFAQELGYTFKPGPTFSRNMFQNPIFSAV
jgi:hypothetical protein